MWSVCEGYSRVYWRRIQRRLVWTRAESDPVQPHHHCQQRQRVQRRVVRWSPVSAPPVDARTTPATTCLPAPTTTSSPSSWNTPPRNPPADQPVLTFVRAATSQIAKHFRSRVQLTWSAVLLQVPDLQLHLRSQYQVQLLYDDCSVEILLPKRLRESVDSLSPQR